ncbi:hypothetical protein SUDANB105_02706 [Streptomyces sp. enrichment culture]|uniref:hypothetical protein n=1 Tax=Streptomyces sp. enrichment culture TaxID=1795815 RepID=UPI003F55ADB1
MSIIHVLLRWIRALYVPGPGRHRSGTSAAAVPMPTDEPRATHPAAAPLPIHRSPYGLPTPLDVRTAASVRPYVRATDMEWVAA